MNLYCSIPDCGKPVENRDLGLCATHSRAARKEACSSAIKKRTITKELKDSNLWIPFSKFIRLRDSDDRGVCTCFTCSATGIWNDGFMQAGHFIGRRHWATRYHEMNVHAQCSDCNKFNGGMQFEYGIKLDQVYGKGTAMMLRELSNTEKRITQFEIDEMAAMYRQKAKDLLAQKNYTDLLEPHKI